MWKRARWPFVVGGIWVVAVALAATSAADVLVLKSGAELKGEVTDRGDSYLLVRPEGGKMTVPKSIVKEVIKSQGGSAGDARPEAADTVSLALKPAREKIAAARRELNEAMQEFQTRHEAQWKEAVSPEDRERIETAESNLQRVRGLAGSIGKKTDHPTPGIVNERAVAASTKLTMPGGAEKTIMVTAANRRSIVRTFEDMVRDERARAKANAQKKVAQAPREELAPWEELRGRLNKLAQSLDAGAAEISKLDPGHAATKAKIAALQKGIEDGLAAVARDLKELRSGHVPAPAPAEPAKKSEGRE